MKKLYRFYLIAGALAIFLLTLSRLLPFFDLHDFFQGFLTGLGIVLIIAGSIWGISQRRMNT